MNIEEIKMDHFENFEELIKNCKMWLRDDDIDAYYRFFEFECMKALVTAYEKEKEKVEVLYTEKQKLFDDIKELLKQNPYDKKLHYRYIETPKVEGQWYKSEDYIEENYISKDKIKAKIEEYDDKGMTVNLAIRSAGKTFEQAVRYEVKKVLQSLLDEKE